MRLVGQVHRDGSAWLRPSSASGGSAWPSSSSNGWPSTAACDAPWRTSTISIASGGRE